MQFIDSHCHLTYEPMFSDLDNVIDECKKNDISHLLSISTNLETATKSIHIANTYPNVYTTIGLHPCEVKDNFNDLDKIFSLLTTSKKIIAIGEIGLDFYRYKNNRSKQIEIFEKQINFANKNNLPIVIHTRSANDDMFSIIESTLKKKNIKFLIHCFSENSEFCKKLLNLGCYISFSGIVTFKNASEIKKSAILTPLDRILVETDAPYLSPEPLRGKVNSPLNVKYVAKYISKLKNVALDKFSEQTSENFNNFFNINVK